jgi:hypothetical protein
METRPVRYPDGEEAHLGDRVALWDGNEGTVVCSIDTQEYSDAYPKEQWAYLGRGVLIFSEMVGLIHYIEPGAGMQLLSRSKT